MGRLAELKAHGLSLDEIARLDPADRLVLLQQLEAIRARRRLEAIADLAAAMKGDSEAAKELKEHLAVTAYGDDEETLAQVLHAIHT